MNSKDAFIIAESISDEIFNRLSVVEREAIYMAFDALKEKAKMDCSKQYIRFGDFPEDKISKAHRGDAITKVEEGLSVWNCAFVNDVPFPLLPENASESAMADYFDMLLGDKPVYLVSGTELESVGSDGEPLLGADAYIVRDYTGDYNYLKKIHTRNKEDEKDPGIKYLHWTYITDTHDHPCDTADRLVAYYDEYGHRMLGKGYYTDRMLGEEWKILFGTDWKVCDRVYAWADLPIIDDFLTCDAPNPKTLTVADDTFDFYDKCVVPTTDFTTETKPSETTCNKIGINTVTRDSAIQQGDEIISLKDNKLGVVLAIEIGTNGVAQWKMFWRDGINRFHIGYLHEGETFCITGEHYELDVLSYSELEKFMEAKNCYDLIREVVDTNHE